MKRNTGLAVAMAVVLAGALLSSGVSPHAAEARPKPDQPVVLLNRYICLALINAFGGDPLGCSNTNSWDQDIPTSFAPVLAHNDSGVAKASDLKSIDLDKNQLHEKDGELFAAVFVDRAARVTIRVDHALIYDNAGNYRGKDYICGDFGVSAGDDPDCVSDSSPSANKNGIVTFSLRPDPKAPRGPGLLTIVQDRYPVDTAFTVVGEASDIKFVNLETNLEVGADGGVANPDASPSALASRIKVTATKDDDCSLPGGAAGFLDANGTAQRTVSLVRAFDSDGTSMTGAFIRWQSDNPEIGTVAAPLTPTIDLGTFGLGAPNIACGTAIPGTFHLKATTLANQKGDSGAVLDPNVVAGIDRFATFTVAGAPATIGLTASPDAMPCDGTGTSMVTASVIDENGDPVADGQVVNFDVVAFGTADPLKAKVKNGVATSVIAPLASAQTSVTVNVTASANEGKFFDLQTAKNSIRIDCNRGGAAAPAGVTSGAGSGGAPANSAPSGAIRGPDTGSGPVRFGNGASGFGPWPFVALALAAAIVAGLRFALKKVN